MQKEKTQYKLLTFYKFVDIDDPMSVVADHKQFCKDIGLKGRIYIGEEGINATVTGNTGQITAYQLYLDSIEYFKNIDDIENKSCVVDEHKFKKMVVRYRQEIVALGEKYSAEDIKKAKHKISVDDFKNLLDSERDDYVVIDMRNNYEYKLGHFKNAIPAGTVNFRDLKKVLNHYKEEFSDKQIIMYCTGGIRCEKAAVMLEKADIPNIYQLDGGVVKYVNKYKSDNWKGNLYTFDERVSCSVDDDHEVISECHYTGEPAEEFHNCRYGPCNAQFIAKPKEYRKHMGFCSHECADNAYHDLLIKDEDWDSMEYKKLRGLIKQDESKKEEITEIIQTHLKKKLTGVQFNHSHPIKEKLLYDEIA